MSESISKTDSQVLLDKVKKALGKKCACFVLITCTEPAPDGKMQVELNFEGDESLAAFLVDNASQVFSESQQHRESK